MELEGQRVWLIASEGQEGVATFGDAIDAGAAGGCLVGWVLLDGAVQYRSAETFAADQQLHCVPPDSPYAYTAAGSPVFGWRVVASACLPTPLPLPAMRRLHRSVYKLC